MRTKENSMIALDVAQLMKMSQDQLDELFRNSPAGDIPAGEGDGTALMAPGTAFSEIAAKLIHLFAWQGKVFDPVAGELRNKILPVGIEALLAKVYKGQSWVDGKECIVVDYSQTQSLAPWGRDEIRQVGPKLYLGIAYLDKLKLWDFALDFQ
jgi:hypothetical protein